MNLQHLIDMQKSLDAHIENEHDLENEDLIKDTFVALQVELAEFANEGRWFKYWSHDKQPRKYEKVVDPLSDVEQLDDDIYCCIDKHEKGYYVKNALLEEYVDALHFFLSLAIKKDWEEALYVFEEQIDPNEFDGDLSGYYLQMTFFLNTAFMNKVGLSEQLGFDSNEYGFRMAWLCFLNIGINGFGFTDEQIENAYKAKNNINHRRQNTFY